MRKLLFYFLFIPQVIFAQNIAELQEAAQKKNNAESWNLLAKYYAEAEDTALCRINAEKAYRLALAENNNKEIGFAILLLANRYAGEPDLTTFVEENEKALGYLLLSQDVDLQREALNNIGTAYNIMGNYDESIPVFRRAIEISEKHKRKDSHLASLLINTGYAFLYKAELDSCLSYVGSALRVAGEVKDTVVLIEGHNQSGIINSRKGNYGIALEHYEKSLALYEQTENHLRVCTSLINITTLYAGWRKYDKALPFGRKAVEYAYSQNQPPQILGACLRIFGNLLVSNGEYQAGLDSIKKALSFQTPNVDDQVQANIYMTKAYELLNKKDSALYCIEKAEEILAGNPGLSRTIFLLMKGTFWVRNEKYKEAIPALEEFVKLQANVSRRSLADAYEAYNALAKAYELGYGNYEKALFYKKTAYDKRDSLLNDEHNEKLSEYYAQYQTAEKELEIARLNEEKQAILFNRTLITGGLVILSIVLFTAWLYSRFRMLRKEKEAELGKMRHYLNGLEAERNRLARDLHDIVANRLFVLELALKDIADIPGAIPAQVEELYTLTRSISHDLVSPSFQHLTLPEILSNHIEETKERTAIHITMAIDGESGFAHLPLSVSHEVYRIMQECLGNAVRHSKADNINISLSVKEGIVSLAVKDDGTGFDREKQTRGIGIKVIQDRVKSLNGSLTIKTGKGEGTEILVTIPSGDR